MPKILFYDIETMANLAWVWGKYEQNVIAYDKESYIISVAAKWLGKKPFAYSLPDFQNYKPGSSNDKELVKRIWQLFDEADIIVAHNGNRFDVKKVNARFLYYKLPPPSPYKMVDTKVAAKSIAMFNSNKLNDLGEHLNEGKKIDTGGFELWLGCLKGDKKAWSKMVRYNIQDVVLLEKIYLRLLPYIKNHPNIGIYTGNASCSKCGSKHLQSRGYSVTAVAKYRRFQCQDCAAWSREILNQRTEEIYVAA